MSDIRDAIALLRQEYISQPLRRNHLVDDPLEQFHLWFNEASQADVPEPNTMTLATANSDGAPSCRTVLLKNCDDRGFIFFTNYLSRKGQDLAANPQASLLFYWGPLHRQVAVRGVVVKVPREESEEYFHSRPVDSQLGAWASVQSAVIPGRPFLEKHFADLTREHADKPVPLPDYWGGYCVKPIEIEFWQGRENRMHDRVLYRQEDGQWTRERLSP